MVLKVDWHGVFPAVPTQFHDDLSLDIPSTKKHVKDLLEEGIHGLVMLGTIGENCSLNMDEKMQVLKATVEVVDGNIPVLTGVAEYTTQMACETVAAAKEAGVDGIMLLPAMVYKSDERELMAHYRSVAESTDLPIMCYNNRPVYGVDMSPENFKELADLENIVCIKEASGDARNVTTLINALGDRYLIFAGLDDCTLESVMLGCVGWVSGLVDAFPRENRLLWDYASTGQWEKALEVYRWYMPMLKFDSHPKLVQYIKLTCAEMGYGTELTRPPRLPLVGEERENLLSIVRQCVATRPGTEAEA
jgi:dihydrodipicolinate synthase/N-acetylneuraminate lyase